MSKPYDTQELQRLVDFNKILATLSRNKLLWLLPTIVCTGVGVLYAFTKSDKWVASQALVVRDEAIGEMGFSGNSGPLGRFESNDSLKRSLETILQIAKHRQVVGSALKQVGPDAKFTGEKPAWPPAEVIEDTQDKITVSAPKGTEFGTSEVIYLSVPSPSSPRAIALTGAVCDQLERRMGDLRNEYAKSIIAELRQKRNLAERELYAATLQLSAMEQQLGSDLGEMRTLAEAGSAGESNLRGQVNQIKVELRQVEANSETQAELLDFLTLVADQPGRIVSMPNRLLKTQPALARLKNGLTDAQLRTARLKGELTNDHPRVRAARLYEDNIGSQLQGEVKAALVAAQAEKAVNGRLAASVKQKLSEVQGRLDRLAALRATYVNLTAKVDQRREQLRVASTSLDEARGRQEAARASSLITRLDDPFTGSRPKGPGKATIIGAATIGGLGLGLSLVYLLAPWQSGNRIGRAANQAARSLDARAQHQTEQARHANRVQQTAQASQGMQFRSLSGSDSVEESLDHLAQITAAEK